MPKVGILFKSISFSELVKIIFTVQGRALKELPRPEAKHKKLIELLRGADYVIEENGWVAAWGAASFELNCKSMEFSNYPYDKHKCEFFIRSDFYTDVIKRCNVLLSYRL